MDKRRNDKEKHQAGGITHKQDKNAGSGAFNQGSDQEPDYNDSVKISDEEKRTGRKPRLGKEKENPKDGNIGKNNAGGYR